jgi:putative chitinase
MSKITLELLKQICPTTKATVLAKYVEPLNTIGEHFDLFENPKRMAAFLAQISHESGGFNIIKENLNYSALGLTKTFKKYFPTLAIATPYAKNPAKIANKVYANRMMNGPPASGDGYKYCGRGLIQLTGKQNYTKFAKSINKTLAETIAYLETPEGAVASAGWFWNANKLNIYADKEDFTGLTRRINGGTIGLADRKHHYDIAIKVLGKE